MIARNPTWKKIEKRVFVMAEIGKGFIQTRAEQPVEVYLENAKALVRQAKAAGADAVKFQTHWVEDEVAPIEFDAPHFKGQNRYPWVRRNTDATPLDRFWKPLKAFCEEQGSVFFSTPMSRGAAQILQLVGVDLWKVGSADLLDFVLLDYLAKTDKPIIISSGMSTLDEVDRAVRFLRKQNATFALMHCVSKYPCPPEDLHLATIPFFRERYAIPIGFSDHSLGIESALGAVALGATILEKHFSLSRDLWGPDHKVSLRPDEFQALVCGVRELEQDPRKKETYLRTKAVRSGWGSSTKVLHEDEASFRPVFRKSLVASCEIPAGSVITPDMLYAMRPQKYLGGLPSEEYETLIGRRTTHLIKKYDPIHQDMLA